MEQQLIYLPKEFRKKVKTKAVDLNKSISDIVQDALRFYLSYLEKNKETAQTLV